MKSFKDRKVRKSIDIEGDICGTISNILYLKCLERTFPLRMYFSELSAHQGKMKHKISEVFHRVSRMTMEAILGENQEEDKHCVPVILGVKDFFWVSGREVSQLLRQELSLTIVNTLSPSLPIFLHSVEHLTPPQ